VKLTPLEPWIQSKIGPQRAGLHRSDLEAYQLDRLRQTIHLAREKSRFYSNHLAGVPGELSRLEDLARLPFTTPEDIRNQGLQFVCVSQSEIQRVVTLDSSGTTGSPKRIYFTQADQELTIDFFHHGMSTFTSAGDRVMILLPHERPGSVGDLLAIGLERLGAIPVRYGPVRNLADVWNANQVMQERQVNLLVGAPTNVLTLARFWESQWLDSPIKPEQVLLSTDHVPQAIVAALEGTWGCTVYNHYGMTEMGLGGGVECQMRRGYHLREADLYFEIIDPHTGQPVPHGAWGEIVFTTLTRQAMPLIRYRSGDLSRFIPGRCECGTILKTLETVRRRLSGRVALDQTVKAGIAIEEHDLGAGNPYFFTMADLDEALFPIPQLVNFSASLVNSEGRDRLEIEMMVLPESSRAIEDRARQALMTIPAIRAAVEGKMLQLIFQTRIFDAAASCSLAKRVLVDRRWEGYARNLD